MYSHESTEMFGSECQRFIFNHGDNGLSLETCFGQLNCLTSFFLRKIFTDDCCHICTGIVAPWHRTIT